MFAMGWDSRPRENQAQYANYVIVKALQSSEFVRGEGDLTSTKERLDLHHHGCDDP